MRTAKIALAHLLLVLALAAGITSWVSAQEKPAQLVQVWEIFNRNFSPHGEPNEVHVYKLQVGSKMVCRATAVYYRKAASLGDVPCPE